MREETNERSRTATTLLLATGIGIALEPARALACASCALRDDDAGRSVLQAGMIALPFALAGATILALRRCGRAGAAGEDSPPPPARRGDSIAPHGGSGEMGEDPPVTGASTGASAAALGMALFIGAWTMMFAGLLFTAAALRRGAPGAASAGRGALPDGLLAVNTAVLLTSCAVLEAGLWARRAGREVWARAGAIVSAGLGMAFLTGQGLVARRLTTGGMAPASGPYGAMLHGLGGVHAVHVGAGIVVLLALVGRGARGLRLGAVYWHFVAAAWLAVLAVAWSP